MTPNELKSLVGKRVGTSSWVLVDQARIDQFADITEDWQFIHIDPERTKAETALPGTIAHGFLTLSLLSKMAYEMPTEIEGAVMSFNYGFDKVRFLAPVPAGARIRAHFELSSMEERNPGEILTNLKVSMEIEGSDRPALVAEWLGLYLMETGK